MMVFIFKFHFKPLAFNRSCYIFKEKFPFSVENTSHFFELIFEYQSSESILGFMFMKLFDVHLITELHKSRYESIVGVTFLQNNIFLCLYVIELINLIYKINIVLNKCPFSFYLHFSSSLALAVFCLSSLWSVLILTLVSMGSFHTSIRFLY